MAATANAAAAARQEHQSCPSGRPIVATSRLLSILATGLTLCCCYYYVTTLDGASNRCPREKCKNFAYFADAAAVEKFSKVGHNWDSICGTDLHRQSTSRILAENASSSATSNQAFTQFISRLENPADRPERLARLASQPVIIGFNVFYERSLAAQLGYDRTRVAKLVRNLMYETQLYYEQPAMRERVYISMLVLQIIPVDGIVGRGLLVDPLLREFTDEIVYYSKFKDSSRLADLNLLLVFRNLYYQKVDTGVQGKVFGVANLATFCHSNQPNSIVVQAFSAMSAHILAHEIGHTLNAYHDDDERHPIARQCPSATYIMSPSLSPNTLSWSECTIQQISEYLIDDRIFKCVYKPDRLAQLKSFRAEFDFSLNGPNREPLPGQDMSLDEHCKTMFGHQAESTQRALGDNKSPESYESCQEAVCRFVRPQFGELRIRLGPALTGSECSSRYSGESGRCVNSICQIASKLTR